MPRVTVSPLSRRRAPRLERSCAVREARDDVIVHEAEPFNVETGLAALAEGPLTATDAFYVRGHGAVPELDAGGVPPARPRARRARAVALAADAARGVPRVRGDRDAAVRRQPPRRPDRDPRHPGRGAVGAGRDRDRDVVGRPARRRARAGRPARAAPRTSASTAPTCARRPSRRSASAARSRSTRRAGPEVLLAWSMNGEPLTPVHGAPLRVVVPGLHRRAQREVARADRGPRAPVGRATSSTSSTGCCPRTARRGRAAGCRSGSWR